MPQTSCSRPADGWSMGTSGSSEGSTTHSRSRTETSEPTGYAASETVLIAVPSLPARAISFGLHGSDAMLPVRTAFGDQDAYASFTNTRDQA